MLEARLSSIDKSFRDNTRMSQLLRRYVPELPRDRVLTKQEFALFEKKIRAKLTELGCLPCPAVADHELDGYGNTRLAGSG